MADVRYTVAEHIGVLSTSGKYSMELNLISYNDNPPKYDLRRWQGDGTAKIMGKGITLSGDEARVLYGLLKERFEEGGVIAEPAD